MKEYPFVSAMIVARNEENYISKCLQSLLEQTYPPDRYEILIIDGMSNDETLSIAKMIENKYSYRKINNNNEKVKVKVRYLNNPQKILAAGWNLGIRESEGEYVIRIDAHGYADENFILNSVETMISVGDAVCVGGSMVTESLSEKGKVIADVLSSPFGVGNSKFRYSQKPQYVDTVAFGLYKKTIFHTVGYFDESLKRNQDNDMHRRIRENGGKFFLNPEIKSTYHPRETTKSMMKQGFQNGKWNIVTFRKDRNSVSLRHLIPLFFVSGIIGLSLLGLYFKSFWDLLVILLGLYFLLGFVFAFIKTKKIINFIKMPFLFFLLHVAYGYGSLISIFNLGGKR
jgi:glycosyltransferase involved in cell wall biosynthesis